MPSAHALPRPILGALLATLAAASLLLSACAGIASGSGWTTLIDGGKGLENWIQTGDANWRAEDGAIVADRGTTGYLVSKQSYTDFVIRAEFWAASDTNSGIFIRLSDPAKITASTGYEVNVWDIRPDPTFGTGAIVNFAAVPVPPVYLAGGRWNTFEIEARGPLITVKLNGATTATLRDAKLLAGPFALQFGPGVKGATSAPIKWRSVQIKAL